MGADHLVLGTESPVEAVAEWTVLRALRWPGRWFPSVVRVLVGPGGVFVIAAHPTTAAVTLADDRVWVGDRPDDQSLSDVTDAALVVAQHVGPHAAQVQPVLCFTSTPVTRGHAGDVLCSSVHDLVGWLSRLPAVLGARQIEDVVTRLRATLGAEVDAGPSGTGDEPAPVALPGEAVPVTTSKSRRSTGLRALSAAVSSVGRMVTRGGLAARFAVLTVLTLAMLAYGPGALNPLGGVLDRWFSDATTPAACPAAGAAAGTSSGMPGASASGSGVPGAEQTSGRGGPVIPVAPAQERAQWTPTGQALASATHPLCRGR